MTKRLTLFSMALGSVAAFAIPTTANASPVLTMPAGTPVKVGSQIAGISTNAVTKTSLGTITCEKVNITAKVAGNSGTEILVVGVGEGVSTGCKLGTTGITLTHITFAELVSSTSTTGGSLFGFTADLPGLTCRYSSKTGSTPTSWVLGGSSIHLAGELTVTPAACGIASFSGDFSLVTTPAGGGGAVIIS
jgi:hypothetical protein